MFFLFFFLLDLFFSFFVSMCSSSSSYPFVVLTSGVAYYGFKLTLPKLYSRSLCGDAL